MPARDEAAAEIARVWFARIGAANLDLRLVAPGGMADALNGFDGGEVVLCHANDDVEPNALADLLGAKRAHAAQIVAKPVWDWRRQDGGERVRLVPNGQAAEALLVTDCRSAASATGANCGPVLAPASLLRSCAPERLEKVLTGAGNPLDLLPGNCTVALDTGYGVLARRPDPPRVPQGFSATRAP